MKKFKFNLESLLVIREWEEQQAKQALAQANMLIADAEARAENLSHELEGAYRGWDAVGQGRFTPADRLSLSSLVSDIELRMMKAKQERQQLADQRRRAMEALMLATSKKKAVEKLKEKRLAEHEAEALKREAMEIEDIFNARRSA